MSNEELYKKFIKTQWLLKKCHYHNYSSLGPMSDTSRGQGRILETLKTNDNISTKDLACLLNISTSSLNELLIKLEKSEYITREISDLDKRVTIIKLTQKGREEKKPEKNVYDVLDCLCEDEKIELDEYLDRIIDNLQIKLSNLDTNDLDHTQLCDHKRHGHGHFHHNHHRKNKEHNNFKKHNNLDL